MHRPRRSWHGIPPNRWAQVESEHPDCGWLTRGWIHPAGVADDGHLLWRSTDYDHTDLGVMAGDYVHAEKALLEATRELEA